MPAIRPTIDKAGKYPVVQAPCPAFKNSLSDLSAPRAGILHTTEGGWDGSMAVFKTHFAPHFAVGLNGDGKAEIAQLVPVGVIGAACREHNAKALVEIEMVAFCKETLWLPDDVTLDALASLMVVCRDEWGIPLSHPWATGDYGRAGHNPHRSSGKFGSVAGWFGHADMPDPDTHWDPGNLNWDAVFAHANSLAPAPSASPLPPAPDPTQSANRGPAYYQAALIVLGGSSDLRVDGFWGPDSRAAMAKWQIANGYYSLDGDLTSEAKAQIDKAMAAHRGQS